LRAAILSSITCKSVLQTRSAHGTNITAFRFEVLLRSRVFQWSSSSKNRSGTPQQAMLSRQNLSVIVSHWMQLVLCVFLPATGIRYSFGILESGWNIRMFSGKSLSTTGTIRALV